MVRRIYSSGPLEALAAMTSRALCHFVIHWWRTSQWSSEPLTGGSDFNHVWCVVDFPARIIRHLDPLLASLASFGCLPAAEAGLSGATARACLVPRACVSVTYSLLHFPTACLPAFSNDQLPSSIFHHHLPSCHHLSACWDFSFPASRGLCGSFPSSSSS